jgi:4'-phosphopantetheinyl transferase
MMGAVATVLWGHLDRLDAASVEPLLSGDERSRAASFRFERDRSRFVAARGLLRMVLGEHLGADPKRIEFAYGERGKPRLAGDPGLRFSLSHSGGVVALALCEDREVGIDLEARRELLVSEGIARRYLPPLSAAKIERRTGSERSREFFRAWVRQEAYAKARGAGLELMGESPNPEDWSIADLELLDGYAAALAIEGPAPVDVVATPV